MRANVAKYLAFLAFAVAVVLGCNTALNQTDNGTQPAGVTGSDGGIDSNFTDAPASPGGTGGVVSPIDDNGEPVGEETRSFFTAFQVDPQSEDTAGPKFVVSADINQDGMLDLVSAWNQSQPIQLHLQQQDADGVVTFRTINLGGTTPIAVVAGLEIGQIDDDGWLDVVVLSKATGFVGLCPGSPPTVISNLDGEIIVLFSPGNANQIPDGDAWTEMILVNPFVANVWIHDQFPGNEFKEFNEGKTKPEWNGFTSLVVADIDGNPGDEIITALNPGTCEELSQKPPTNTVDLWMNPGGAQARSPELWGVPTGACCVTGARSPCVGTMTQPECNALGGTWSGNQRCPAPIGSCDVGAQCFEGLTESECNEQGTATDAGIWAEGLFCDGSAITTCSPISVQFSGVPIAILADAPQVKDLGVLDIDSDGDLDVIATFTNSISQNVRWARNPQIPHQTGGAGGLAEVTRGFSDGWRLFAAGWQERPIGQVDTGADIIDIGDIDNDTFDDVLVRSTNGQIVQWFRQPNSLTSEPEFPPNDPVPDRFNFPWQVFTLTEFDSQEPEAISVGDVTGDGRVDVIIASEGAVFWYDGTTAQTVFDPWAPNTIIQDNPPDSTDATQAGPTPPASSPGSGVGVNQVDTSTHINALLIVDLDQDGRNDIVGTLDRRSGAGLSDDRLVWYRNTKTD